MRLGNSQEMEYQCRNLTLTRSASEGIRFAAGWRFGLVCYFLGVALRADFGISSAAFALLLAAGVVIGGGAASGEEFRVEEFRVENKVFVGGEKQPRVQSTTIFYGGLAYDYLEKPAEITVFDKAHGRFVLLDQKRRVKTELTTERVADFTDRLKQWAQTQSDPFLKFLAEPHFDEQFDSSAGELSFTSPWMSYRVTTIDAENEAISRQYGEFSDWYCQLNTLINPGARPPGARMIVNAALEQRQQFPREVQLTLRPKRGLLSKRITVRSQHLLVRRLVESDRDRVAQTDEFMGIFKPVDFQEYQKEIAD